MYEFLFYYSTVIVIVVRVIEGPLIKIIKCKKTHAHTS